MNLNKLLLLLLIISTFSCDDKEQPTQKPDMDTTQEEDLGQDMAGTPIQYMDFTIVETDAETPILDPETD